MPTNFPTSVDNFTNPTANDSLNLPSHSTQHANANDAIEAVEGYLLTGAGAAGLVFLKAQTIGTTVSSVTVTDAFNSTYENYKILYSGGVGSGTFDLLMQLSGITGSVYYTAAIYSYYNGTTPLALNTGAVTTLQRIGAANPNAAQIELDLQNPFLSKVKIGTSRFQIAASDGLAGTGNQWVNSTTSSTGFTITTSSGTLTGGTIYVYGYKKA
jgi:hypothetical protein